MASRDSEHTRAAESATVSDVASGFASLLYGPEFRNDWWYGAGLVIPPYFIDSQKRGEALPVYLNEYGLKVIRDRSRRLAVENEFAVCALENRRSYIVGTGFTYTALPRHKKGDKSLVQQVQTVIDIFAEANSLWQMELEAVYRGDRDGEGFIRMFPQETGLLLLRWVEPEHIRSKTGDTSPEFSFGIETDPRDIASVRGYHIVDQPTLNVVPKFVSGDNVLHFKCNADSASKRGVPLLYPVESNLRRAEELLAAMTTTAKSRAKIALIRRVEGASKSAVQRMKSELETQTTYDPITGGPTNIEELKLGSVLTASKNIDYEFPKNEGNQDAVEVLKAELRSIAARLVMPEPMLSADVSSGSASSYLVAEAPATRNFERLQRFYRAVFGESRAPRNESLVWRQIKHAVDVGILPPQALRDVRIVVSAPDIISRDPDKFAAASKSYFDMGVTSPQEICASLGLDYDKIQEDRKEAGLAPVNQIATATPGSVNAPPDQQPGGEEQGGEGDDNEFEFDGSEFI